MCINLANEQMQVFYQQQVFQQEIADCLAEEVPPVEVTFPSGQEVVDVFMQVGKGSVMSLKVFLTLCIVSHVFVHLPVWMLLVLLEELQFSLCFCGFFSLLFLP